MQITITGNAIAWWGAITGTAGCAVSIVQAWRDKADLLIRVSPGFRPTVPFDGYHADKLYVYVAVANRGRRPVTVVKAWFQLRNSDQKGIVMDSLKGMSELEEGKHVAYLVREDQIDISDLKAIVVEDSTGRLWKKRLDFRQYHSSGDDKTFVPSSPR